MKNEAQPCGVSVAPPPPPPPLPKTPQLVSPGVSAFNQVPLSQLIRRCFDDAYKSIVSYCTPIEPILQEGPQCGIVALAMATQMLCGCTIAEKQLAVPKNRCLGVENSCLVAEIFAEAKRLNYTTAGEMFSAQYLANVAESALGCKAIVLSDLSARKGEILSYICDGWPVLFPYDADKNHEPCLNKGRNAHWAVLCGVAFALSEELSSDFKSLDGEAGIFELFSESEANMFLDKSVRTCVYAHQGKSKNVSLWDFETLVLSNKNMFEATNKFCAKHMIAPNMEDALCELRDKVIILKRD